MIKKLLLTVFLVINLVFAGSVFGQAVGDYRSNVNTTGNWTNSGSWQYYNGTDWVTATNYPGQIAGNYAVLIQVGDVIIANSDINNSIGILTISGQLTLRLEISNYINTQSVVVTATTGSILFGKKSDFNLPENASLQVSANGLAATNQGCTNDNSVYIGLIRYANCNGGGNSDTGLVFENIMDGGGTLNAIATSNSPVCQGSTINLLGSYTGATGTGIAYSWSITNPHSFTTIISTQNPTVSNVILGTYTATLTCSTTYNGNTYSNSDTILLIVNALPSAPLVGTTTQPTCALPTGSVVLSGLPVGGIVNPGNVSYPGTSTTISGLASGNYTFTVFNGSCTSVASSSVVITSPAKTWNGSVSSDWNTSANWTPSGVPTSSNCVTIPNIGWPSIISGTNFVAYANTLTLETSGRLTVNPSNTITVTDFVKVNLGFLTFENTASLVQINNVNNNSEYIVYKRSTTALQTDYTYWSSPVSPMTLGELYPLGSTFYSYEASLAGEDWSPFGAGTDMVAGKGYIANRGAAIPLPGPPPPPDLLNVIFTGVPNNGHYEIANVIADRSYLLGNPYPSALDAETFLNDNVGVLNGTLYFWTHKTPIGTNVSNPGTGVYAYSGNDYATYNATGGAAANQRDIDPSTSQPYADPGGGGSALNGSVIPTGKIASGQGFFASSKEIIPANSKIIYDNTMRVGVNGITGNNSQFFKTKNPSKSSKPIEKNRIWLNLTNTQGAFKQTLVGYITEATNDYDDRFDGESYDGNEFVDFYSVNQDKNLTIQGRALPFDDSDEVPLGFRTTINGAFTIKIDQVDGFLTNQAVFIEDKLTNTVFDLKSGNYTFNTVEGTFDDRFVLRFKDNSVSKTLAAANFDSLEKTVFVSNKNKQIKIDSAVERIDKVTVFDLLGRQIYQKTNVNSNELSITNLVISHQTLIVKTTLQNGITVNRKIIY